MVGQGHRPELSVLPPLRQLRRFRDGRILHAPRQAAVAARRRRPHAHLAKRLALLRPADAERHRRPRLVVEFAPLLGLARRFLGRHPARLLQEPRPRRPARLPGDPRGHGRQFRPRGHARDQPEPDLHFDDRLHAVRHDAELDQRRHAGRVHDGRGRVRPEPVLAGVPPQLHARPMGGRGRLLHLRTRIRRRIANSN